MMTKMLSSTSSMELLRTEGVPGMFRKKFADLKVDSVTHNVQKLYGTDRHKESFSPGSKILKDVQIMTNIQKERMSPSSHSQITSVSPLFVLMKTLY